VYIQTSYTDIELLEKAIREFFDVMCIDESRFFNLHVYRAGQHFDITIDGPIDDFTSHNLVGWLAHPGFWEQSFKTAGRIKHEGREHLVAPNRLDDSGETLLAQGLDGSRYLIYLPECKIIPDTHQCELTLSTSAEGSPLLTLSPSSQPPSRAGCPMPFVTGFGMMLLGIALVWTSLGQGNRYAPFINGDSIQGRIVSVDTKEVGLRSSKFTLTVEWIDHKGSRYSDQIHVSGGRDQFAEGDPIGLLTSVDDPSIAQEERSIRNIAPIVIAGVLMSPLAGIGLGIFVFGLALPFLLHKARIANEQSHQRQA
jgi:hypothetical protein